MKKSEKKKPKFDKLKRKVIENIKRIKNKNKRQDEEKKSKKEKKNHKDTLLNKFEIKVVWI